MDFMTVQFKRITINFFSIIILQIVQCLSYTLFEIGIIPHFMWIRWANAANLKGCFDHLLILNKIVKSFLYPVDHVVTCWYWEFKSDITICIRKTISSTCNVLYPTPFQYGFEWFVKVNIHWLAFRGTTRITFQWLSFDSISLMCSEIIKW